MAEMLRGLLVESFEMKTHPETREVTVYALTLAGSKSKMTRADDLERSGCPGTTRRSQNQRQTSRYCMRAKTPA